MISMEQKYIILKSLSVPIDILFKESKKIILKSLCISRIGYFEAAKNHYIERQNTNEYIIIYCISGIGFIKTKKTYRECTAGDFIFCDKNKFHEYGADNSNPWTIYWTHLIGDGIKDIAEYLNLSEKNPTINIGIHTEYNILFEKAYSSISKGYNYQSLFHSSTLIQTFLSEIIKGSSNKNNDLAINFEKVIEFMQKNVRMNFSLTQLAKIACISKYHFLREFKNKIGYTPVEYFNRQKIQKACELVTITNMSIKEISDYLSFNTPYYFSEVFKKIIGVAPSKYRGKNKTFK